MDERKGFIDEWLSGDWSMIELCLKYGVTRKTGYKMLERFKQEGWPGLEDKSRAPHTSPHKRELTELDIVLQLRREHPRWGPRKLLAAIRRRLPEAILPSHATLSRRFHELGFADGRKPRQRVEGYCSPYNGYHGPNAAWSVDFKGRLLIGKKLRECHPLTIGDVTSRFSLRIDAHPRIDGEKVKRAFESSFCEYGLPDVIRSDNGPPFAAASLGGLSRLSVWWIQLGIRPHRIKPGRPTQNSRHERMHRTLNEECPRGATLHEQQLHFDRFRFMFNHERPHDGLNGKVPADIYVPSPRRYPNRLKDPTYPDDYFVERVGTHGELSFAGHRLHLSEILSNQLLGMHKLDARVWDVYFGPVLLGELNPKGFRPARRNNPL